MVTVDQEKCVGCGQCVPFCPAEAIKVWGKAELKKEGCNDCLLCMGYCPVDALEVKS